MKAITGEHRRPDPAVADGESDRPTATRYVHRAREWVCTAPALCEPTPTLSQPSVGPGPGAVPAGPMLELMDEAGAQHQRIS